MTAEVCPPGRRPCASCPYRRDVPSGVWTEDEYDKLPDYDRPTSEQPFGVFLCHQRDGRVCAGWASVHGDGDNLALRLARLTGGLDLETVERVLEYSSPVPLWLSGAAAAEHGKAGLATPPPAAQRMAVKILRRRARRG